MSSIDGPYFDDLSPGETLPPAPAITIGPGECAVYQAISGDPMRLALSAPLAKTVTGQTRTLVNPALVLNMAIGQSTVATRRVIANLFYRGVRLHRPVFVGATLSTEVQIRGLREATRRSDRPLRGMVLLRMTTIDQNDHTVADFERCALIPFRDQAAADTDRHDDLGGAETDLQLEDWLPWVPSGWDLTTLGPSDSWEAGEERRDPFADSVTEALALVRLTQNQAAAHRDPDSGQRGRRLVYGGHTIGLAQASLGRLLPSIATVIGWHSCDHLAAVFEDDTLGFRATLTESTTASAGRLLAFRVIATARREGTDPVDVLDWRPVVYAP